MGCPERAWGWPGGRVLLPTRCPRQRRHPALRRACPRAHEQLAIALVRRCLLRLWTRLHLIVGQVIRELGLVVTANHIELLPGEALCLGQVGTGEVGPLEVGVVEVGPLELGAAEVGLL